MVDQKEEELGQKLLLPEWLEPDRKYLEKVLPKISTPSLDKFSFHHLHLLIKPIIPHKVKDNEAD